MFEKIKNYFKPELITLTKYKICFITIDEKQHEFNNINYIDEGEILCSALEFYLIGVDKLKDDKGHLYPINNVKEIWFEEVDKIENVIKKGEYKVWYSKNDIKIYQI